MVGSEVKPSRMQPSVVVLEHSGLVIAPLSQKQDRILSIRVMLLGCRLPLNSEPKVIDSGERQCLLAKDLATGLATHSVI